MNCFVKKNNRRYDLYSFIYEQIAETNYAEFRDVDNSVGLITRLLENQSKLIKALFVKNIISESELKEILGCSDFVIEKE